MSGERLTIEVLAPYPSTEVRSTQSIDPRVTAAEWESQDQAGWSSCRIGFMPETNRRLRVSPYLPEPIVAEPRSQVRVLAGDHLLFEGVITNVLPNGRGIEALGYGLWATRYGTIDAGGVTEITSGLIARAAIRGVVWLVTGQVVDPGTKHTGWAAFVSRPSGDVLASLCETGGLLPDGVRSARWMFLVYEDRVAHFVPRLPSDRPDWDLSYDPATMAIGFNMDGVIDGVRARFRGADGIDRFQPESGWLYRSGVDPSDPYLARETITASFDSASAALQHLRTHLDEHAAGQLSGSLTLQGRQYLRVRAGETVGLEGYGELGRAVITHARVNGWTETAEVTLGEPPPRSAAGFFKSLDRIDLAQRHKLDPVSLNPWRF